MTDGFSYIGVPAVSYTHLDVYKRQIVGSLDNTDRIMADTFWVGVYPGMTDEMIDYMARTIKEAVECA